MSDTRYVLGLPEMDEQHRYLYELFDRIEQRTTVTDPTATKALLDEIERYVNFHFTSEEHLMRLYEAPSFAEHQSDHEVAAGKFIQFLDEFDRGQLNPAKMRIFLTGWLMEHSRLSDAQYVAWVLAKREEVRAAAAAL